MAVLIFGVRSADAARMPDSQIGSRPFTSDPIDFRCGWMQPSATPRVSRSSVSGSESPPPRISAQLPMATSARRSRSVRICQPPPIPEPQCRRSTMWCAAPAVRRKSPASPHFCAPSTNLSAVSQPDAHDAEFVAGGQGAPMFIKGPLRTNDLCIGSIQSRNVGKRHV